MAAIAYAERLGESKRWGGWLNWAFSAGLITDALVNANATLTLLKAAILAQTVKAEQRPMLTYINLALDRAKAMSQLSETHGKTTVAGLVAESDASTTFKQGYYG